MGRRPLTREQATKLFWSRVQRGEGCWEWTASRDSGGYGQMWWFRGTLPMRAHRIAWELTYGPIPPGLVIRHRCDNPPCARPDHLEIGTQAENVADAITRKRIRGSSPETVARIRALRAQGVKLRVLAEEFGLHTSTISLMVNHRSYRSLRP